MLRFSQYEFGVSECDATKCHCLVVNVMCALLQNYLSTIVTPGCHTALAKLSSHKNHYLLLVVKCYHVWGYLGCSAAIVATLSSRIMCFSILFLSCNFIAVWVYGKELCLERGNVDNKAIKRCAVIKHT